MSKLWMIERDVPGWTDEDVGAAGVRAKMCLLWYPNMEWQRSLFDRENERIICVYEAESEEDIRHHAVTAGLPCGHVTPVDQLLPSDLPDPTEGDVAAHTSEIGSGPLQDGAPV